MILDWAGTTMDFGCMAPAVVFMQVFEKAGVPISIEEARVPMGAHKKVHIGLICQIPSVRRRWIDTHGSEPTQDDVDRMFEDFVPMQDYVPDATFGAGDVPRGRPYPHMVLRNIVELDVSPVQSVVKVDDTLTGIEEGLNAGCWAVGLAISGNEVGVQLDEWDAFSEEVKQAHRDRIYPSMYQRGAHYVVDSIADLMPCLDGIETRLARGEKP